VAVINTGSVAPIGTHFNTVDNVRFGNLPPHHFIMSLAASTGAMDVDSTDVYDGSGRATYSFADSVGGGVSVEWSLSTTDQDTSVALFTKVFGLPTDLVSGSYNELSGEAATQDGEDADDCNMLLAVKQDQNWIAKFGWRRQFDNQRRSQLNLNAFAGHDIGFLFNDDPGDVARVRITVVDGDSLLGRQFLGLNQANPPSRGGAKSRTTSKSPGFSAGFEE
jgi:hypothetical protein